MAYKALKGCDCERSCTKCLIDRRSQWYLNYLNRQKVIDWMETERLARIAPSEISDIVPAASGISSDLATEFSQLCRNQNLRSLRIFIDNDYSLWCPSEYPFNRLVEDLKVHGVSVVFVLNKELKISEIPSEERAMILSTIFKWQFGVYNSTLPSNLKPLIEAELNDGSRELYFGTDIERTLSDKWGSGVIYQSPSPVEFIYSAILPESIINQLASETDSIMFDTRIKEDCSISEVFKSLMNYKADKWELIKNRLESKSVSIEYSDRYLYTPLGCMIFAHMLKSIEEFLNIQIIQIILNLTKPYGNYGVAAEDVNVCDNFGSSADRNLFLAKVIGSLTGITPSITDSGYIQHERSLAIRSLDNELFIRPDAGIANGWKPFGRSNSDLKVKSVCDDLEINLPLYNQKKNGEGILYTVSFNIK